MAYMLTTLTAIASAVSLVISSPAMADDARFRQIAVQSTETSCGAASAANWLRRLGYRVREGDILATLEGLWQAKRQLVSAVRAGAAAGVERDELLAVAHAMLDGGVGDANPVAEAVARLKRMKYSDDDILFVVQAAADGAYVPAGNQVGASRADLAWAVNALGLDITAAWRRLDAAKLLGLTEPVRLGGVVLLPAADHFVEVIGFDIDLDGAHAMLADPSPHTGGNLLEPITRFVAAADPQDSGAVWILTLQRKAGRHPTPARAAAFSDPPRFASTDWWVRARGVLQLTQEDDSTPRINLPLTRGVAVYAAFGQPARLAIEGALAKGSGSTVTVAAGVVGSEAESGRSVAIRLRSVAGLELLSFERSATSPRLGIAASANVATTKRSSILAAHLSTIGIPATVELRRDAYIGPSASVGFQGAITLTSDRRGNAGEWSISALRDSDGATRLGIGYVLGW